MPADRLFLAGLLPGLVLVVIVALYGITVGRRVNASRQAFSPREALAATWEAKWELSIPLGMIVLFATGAASLRDGGLRGHLHDRDRLLHPWRPDAGTGSPARSCAALR